MLRITCMLILFTVAPALAQDYTVVAVSHTDNKVSEVDPLTGETLREFVVPGEWFGETHEGAISPDGGTMYVSVPYKKQVIILDLDTFAPRGVIESEYFSRPSHVRGFARIGRRESSSSDPHGVALNNDGSKLYITVQNAQVPGVVVYDVEAGTLKKIDTVIAGNYLWVHPRTDKLYFPTRDDRVVVIDTKTDRIVNVIRLHAGSRPNGVDFGGPNDEVWINGDGDGSITVIDSSTDEVISVIQPRVSGAGRVAVSPDGRLAAATQGVEVSIIDTRTKEILASLRMSPLDTTLLWPFTEESGHGFPMFSPDSNHLHVLSEYSGDMVTFDMRTMSQVGGRTPVGGASFGGGVRVFEQR
jgi:DNA-binding beta-propeller fold protein YncE